MLGTPRSERPRASPSGREREPALAVIVLGMSAGGLYGFKTLVRALPVDFAGALVIAHHVAAPSLLPQLVNLWSGHDCWFASTGELLHSGVIYVAPAEHHVVINPDATLGVSSRDRVCFVRPSIDWLFESAAGSFGERAVAVVLSGANADGAVGARCIARAGGRVIVQDPDTCEYPQMPNAVIATGVGHRRLHPCELGDALSRELSRIHAESLHAWNPFGLDQLTPTAV